MIGSIRDSLNQAPPWVAYSIVGVVLVAAIGLIVWNLAPSSTGTEGEIDFYCPDCDTGFTVEAEEARDLRREAAKANKGGRALVKCRKCNQYTCVVGVKCKKCGTYFEMPEKTGSIFPDSWRDECPKCGYSEQRDRAVRAALKQKKEGKYDPNRMPEFIRESVEEAEASGEYDDVK